MNDCENCFAGKYNNLPNATACLPCPKSTYEDERGSTKCVKGCDPGFTAQAFVREGAKAEEELSCSACYCAIGQVCDGVNEEGDNIFKTCQAGRYADRVGLTKCKLCEAGKFAADEMSGLCSDCLPGFISGEEAVACQQCALGTKSSADNTECLLCNPGEFSGSSPTNVCNLCPSGTIPTPQQDLCVACPAGKFSVAGDSNCTACEQGSFASSGSSTCARCIAGKISNAALTGCTSCHAGTYSGNGASQCQQCDIGKVALEEASMCHSCSSGKKSSPTNDFCFDCPAGKFSGISEGSCTVCPLGKYASKNATGTCSLCPGTQESLPDFTGCRCKVGFVPITENGILTCQCDVGFEFIQSLQQCAICRAGAYKDFIGNEPCLSCDQNSVKDSFQTSHSIMVLLGDDHADQHPPINKTSCACERNYYLNPHPPYGAEYADFIGECKECPDGTKCNERGVTLATLPVMDGFWRSSGDSANVVECYTKSACGGQKNVSGLLGTTNVDDQCTIGHRGPQCNVCEDDYVISVLGGCEVCGETFIPPQMIYAALVMLGFLLLILFLVRKRIYQRLVQFHICGSNKERESLMRDSGGESRVSNVSPRRGSVGMSPFATEMKNRNTSFDLDLGKELTEEEVYHLRKNRNSIWNRAKTKGKILVACYQIVSQYENILDVRYPALFEDFGRRIESVMVRVARGNGGGAMED